MTKEAFVPKIDALAASVQELATPGSKAKEIIAAVRERHPGASKKDVVRAAFFALIGGMEEDPEKAKRIHDLAIAERAADDAAPSASVRPKKSKHKQKAGTDARRA